MHNHVTARPLSSLYSEGADDIFPGEELIDVGEVVAKRRVFALLSDVIHIEPGGDRDSQNGLSGDLADVKSGKPNSRFNSGLTCHISDLQGIILEVADKFIFVGKLGIGWILDSRVNPSISNSKSDKFDFGVLLFMHIGSDGGDKMSRIGLSGNEKSTVLVFRVLGQKSCEK